MKPRPAIYWKFEEPEYAALNITGSAGDISLTFYIQRSKFDAPPPDAALIVGTMRRLEEVLIETIALNERRKEHP